MTSDLGPRLVSSLFVSKQHIWVCAAESPLLVHVSLPIILCSIWTAILFATSTAVVSREKYFVAFVLIFQALTNASFPWQGSKSMRLDTEEWVSIEQYVTDNSEVQLSHGICERCLVEHY